MSDKPELFIEVIMPLALNNLFTYSVPEEFRANIQRGQRVIVQFGKSKIYAAIVYRIHSDKPENYQVKPIIDILDPTPMLQDLHLEFWHWISDYYLCSIGEVMKAALPAGMKLESETTVFWKQSGAGVKHELTEKEELVAQIIESHSHLSIKELNKILNKRSALGTLQALMRKNLVGIEENIKRAYKPKMQDFIRLHPDYKEDSAVKILFDSLSHAPAQMKMLMAYLQQVGSKRDKLIDKKQLLKMADATPATLKSMLSKEIFNQESVEVNRLTDFRGKVIDAYELSEAQQTALQECRAAFQSHQVVLIHGVTSSGKTEVYIQLIQEQIDNNKQVLFLLPEIAITAQIINRLRRNFGNKVGVYHSKFSDAERVEIWEKIIAYNQDKTTDYQIIIGVRSAIFLPFSNLGLIIVDEEHETTYKQFDPAPRYHARDAAIVLAQKHKAKTLLGTATPAIETYYNAQIGKYGFVALTTRYKNIKLPQINIAKLPRQSKKQQGNRLLSVELSNLIDNSLKASKQIILFQNRRGYSPYLQCDVCQTIPSCNNCDVSLTYHKFSNTLTCHYCGYSESYQGNCKACGSNNITTRGYGTEKIEDEIKLIFRDTTVARMDLDTTRAKQAYEQLIDKFENQQIDILVGTQMVSKGLDFENVAAVGILNADSMLNFPDFRAHERSYQLMTQVSGRAGRKGDQGQVVIQTTTPKHPVIQDVITGDYESLYRRELSDRKEFLYPPYSRLVRLTVKNKDNAKSELTAQQLGVLLRKKLGPRVLGPEKPLVGRIQLWHLQQIWIKIESGKSVAKAKKIIVQAINDCLQIAGNKSSMVIVDVDPY